MTLFNEYQNDPVALELFTFTVNDEALYQGRGKLTISCIGRANYYQRPMDTNPSELWQDYARLAADKYIADYVEFTTDRKRKVELLKEHFPERTRIRVADLLADHYEDEIAEWRP